MAAGAKPVAAMAAASCATTSTGSAPPLAEASSGAAAKVGAAAAAKGAKKPPPPLGVQPATFLRFILLSDHGEGVSLPGPAGVSAVADAVLLAGEEGIARTAAQPYSGIRGQYSWEELAEGELCIELPEGSARPPYILAQLWEDPNHASNNRARVPKLNALKPLKGGPTAPTPPAGTDAMAGGALPLASAVIQLRPPANAPAAGDGTGEMEVVLKGRAGLGKDYNVRFGYTISIW